MTELDFDILPVVQRGRIRGYVRRSSLGQGPCRLFQEQVTVDDTISSSTDLLSLLRILASRAWVFVLEGDRIRGILTRSDLQRAPARMFLFGLLSLFEAHLLRLIRTYHPDGTWKALIDQKLVHSAEQEFERKRNRNEATDLAECISFGGKLAVALASERIRGAIGPLPRGTPEPEKDLRTLRNNLAHGGDLLRGLTWKALPGIVRWLDRTLVRSGRDSNR